MGCRRPALDTVSKATRGAPAAKCPGQCGARRSVQYYAADFYAELTMADQPWRGPGTCSCAPSVAVLVDPRD